MSRVPNKKDFIVRYMKPGCSQNLAWVFCQVDTSLDYKQRLRELLEEREPGAKILCVGEVINFFCE